MSDRRYRDAEWLREQYCNNKKTVYEIADICDCAASTVSRWLDKHGIDTRSLTDPRLDDSGWLRDQYLGKQKSVSEIADLCGCTRTTVGYWLNKHSIETRHKTPPRLKDAGWLREQYCEKRKTTYEIAELCDCSATTVGQWLDEHNIETRRSCTRAADARLMDGDWLRDQYCTKRKTTYEIADVCGCNKTTVLRWLEEHDIDTREQYRWQAGKEHPNWNGGPRAYGSGWTETKRRTVRRRDGFECARCGLSQGEHQREHGERLHVHHLEKARDINDAEERNAVDNLITLCCSCHRQYEKFADALRPQLITTTTDGA